MSDEERTSLINTMLSARTEEEISEAEKAADKWLEENPADDRVIVARERLESTARKRRDPERIPNRLSVIALLAAALVSGLVVAIGTGDLGTTLQISLVVGLSSGACVWILAGGIWRKSL